MAGAFGRARTRGVAPPFNLTFLAMQTFHRDRKRWRPLRYPVMGWSGRAPAPPASDACAGHQDKEHAMAEALKNSICFVGIDVGKNSFHVVGLDGAAPSCCGSRRRADTPNARRRFARRMKWDCSSTVVGTISGTIPRPAADVSCVRTVFSAVGLPLTVRLARRGSADIGPNPGA